MKIIIEDLWTPSRTPCLVCVTSNASESSWGYLYMGAGSAKQAVARYGDSIRKAASEAIKRACPGIVLDGTEIYGFQVVLPPEGAKSGLALFQTKLGHKDVASLAAVEQSARMLHAWARAHPEAQVRLPLPGTGKGADTTQIPPTRNAVEALLYSLPENVLVCKTAQSLAARQGKQPTRSPR
jgi:hypothetical protein